MLRRISFSLLVAVCPLVPISAAADEVFVADFRPGTDSPAPSVDADDSWVTALLEENPVLAELVTDADELRLQVVVGEIDRGPDGVHVQFHPFRLDDDYLYPASAIKSIGALASLRTLESLREANDGLTIDTPLRFSGLSYENERASTEPLTISEDGETTLRRELERTLIVSSNEGFNRLWDFAGHAGINSSAWDVGLTTVRMRHRLSRQGVPEEAHRLAPAVSAQLETGWVELLPSRASDLVVDANAQADVLVGDAHISAVTGEWVDGPFDFREKNSASLLDLLSLVAAVADPELAPWVELGIDESNRVVLREMMGRIPDESDRFKPFSPGLIGADGWDGWTYINKAGRAYGFHLDAAYVRDDTTEVEFLLAAAIHVNPNGVVNDSRYDYDERSFPFLVALSGAVFERLHQ